MADWTTPRTWVTSETVTAALLNTHIRDNLGFLHDPNASYFITTSDKSTTSATYVAIDGSNSDITITPQGTECFVGVMGIFGNPAFLGTIGVTIDGGSSHTIVSTFIGGSNTRASVANIVKISGLTAASSNTIEFEFKSASNTQTLYAPFLMFVSERLWLPV